MTPTGEITRRRLIVTAWATAGIVGLAGCQEAPPRSVDDRRDTDGWLLPEHDVGNTGHNPHASPPRSDPELRWRTDGFASRAAWSAFVPRQPVVGEETIYTGGDRLAARDLADGTIHWETPLDLTPMGMAMDRENLYVLEESRPGARQAVDCVHLGAYDLDSGRRRWKLTRDWWSPGAPVLAGETIYVSTGSGFEAVSVDGDTIGQVRTERSLGTPSPALTDRLVCNRNALYLRGNSVPGYLADESSASRTTVPIDYHVPASPATTDDYVCIPESITFYINEDANDARLTVTDHGGNEIWTAKAGSRCSSPALTDDVAVVNAARAREIHSAASSVRRRGARAGDFVHRDARLLAFDIESGDRLWQRTYEGFGSWYTSPVCADGTTYAALYDLREDESKIVAVEVADGTQRWEYAPPLPATHLAAVGEALYATLEDWSVLALV